MCLKQIFGLSFLTWSCIDCYTLYIPLQQAAYESCKPLASWVVDLQCRVDFFTKWTDLVTEAKERKLKGQNQPVIDLADLDTLREQPRSFWLPGFFFPQGEICSLICL